jgi:hypothetical protein
MIQMIILKVGCANLREDTVIQNIIILFAYIRDKRSLIFCIQVAVHEREEVGESWYLEAEWRGMDLSKGNALYIEGKRMFLYIVLKQRRLGNNFFVKTGLLYMLQ